MSAVVIKTRVQAENIDALNRKAKYASADLPNGTAVTLAFPSAEGDEVFVATLATTGLEFAIGRKEPIVIANGSLLEDENEDAWLLEVTTAGAWMVVSPEVNKDVIGETYKGLDPRRFVNEKDKPFDVIKLQVGDIIQVSKDFFVDTKDPDTVTGATTVELTSNGFEATA
jgi:hypothetical protein